MTPEQYWKGDPYLAESYRKAFYKQQDYLNEQLWMQGLYFYDALSIIAANLTAKRGTKPKSYPEEPYPLAPRTEEERRERLEREIEKERNRVRQLLNSLKGKKDA